jgi:hypothetical protein
MYFEEVPSGSNEFYWIKLNNEFIHCRFVTLLFQLCLWVPSGLFPLTKILFAFLVSPMHATYSAYLILDLLILILG